MAIARFVVLVGLLAASVGARADFVIRTFNGVVRYSDAGERLIEYGGGDASAANGGFWLGESVDGIAVSDDGFVYAVTNNLGAHSLIRFDLATGAVVPRPGSIPTGDFQTDAPLWTSPALDTEVRCGTEGCTRLMDVLRTTARFQGDLLLHPDGHLYATGIADIWAGTVGGSHLGSQAALIRFDLDEVDAPSVVSILPVSLNVGEHGIVDFADALTLRSDGSIEITTVEGAISVDVASFGNAVIPATLLASPDPTLTDGLDLSGLGGSLGEAFADPFGNIYIPTNGFLPGGSTPVQLHKFEAATGAYLGVVFDELLPIGTVAPELSFSGGVYVAVPEPSAVALVVLVIAGGASRGRVGGCSAS